MADNEIEILLVEDNQSDAELIIRALRKHKLANKIVHVKDGEEALDLFFGSGQMADMDLSTSPKVVLLDLKLPKIGGIEVLQRLKADVRTKDVPVVVLTSSSLESDIKAVYDLGCNSFVTKPIQYEEFVKTITDLGVYWVMLNVTPSNRE